MESVAVSPLEASGAADKLASVHAPVPAFATDSESGVDTPVTESRAQSPADATLKEGASLGATDPSAPGTPVLQARDEEAAPLRAAVESLALDEEPSAGSVEASAAPSGGKNAKRNAKKKAAKKRSKAARAASKSVTPEVSVEASFAEAEAAAEEPAGEARAVVEIVSLDAAASASAPAHPTIVVPGDVELSSGSATSVPEAPEGASSPEAKSPPARSSSSRYGSSFIYAPYDSTMPGLEQLPVHLGKLERDKLEAKARREAGEGTTDDSPSPLAKLRQRYAPDPALPSLEHMPVHHTRLEVEREEALERAEPRRPMRNRALAEHMRAWSESPKPKAAGEEGFAASPAARRGPGSPAHRTLSSSGVASAILGADASPDQARAAEPEVTLEDLLGSRAAAAARVNRGRGERPPRPSHASCIGSLIFGGETAQEVVGVGVAGHSPSPAREPFEASPAASDDGRRTGKSHGPAFRRDQRDSSGVAAVLFG